MSAAIVTIGNFDGVHLGHQMLLHQVVERAHVLGLRSYAVTFDPHPEQVLFPDRGIARLTSASEKRELICACGVHMVPPYRLEGQIVSSTGIRTLLSTGACQGAAELLGRPYFVAAELRRDGALHVDPTRALPRGGLVYEAQVRQDDRDQDVLVSVSPPVVRFEGEQEHALDQGPVRLTFLRRLRSEV